VNGSSHAAEEARFRAAAWWRDEPLAGWVGRHARETPQRTAVLTSRGSVAYADLWGRARRLACGLRQAGVQRGDVVAAQLPNGVEFIVGYLATGLCGAIFQTLHMPYRGAEVGPLLRHSGARAVIATASAQDFSAAAMMLELRAGLPRLAHVVAVGASVAGALDFAALADTPDDGSADLARAEDLFVLLYTSGTTAAPKGVPVTYQRFLSNARLSAIELELTPASVLLSAAPFTHLYGLFSINLAFAAGASIALLPAFSPPALAEAIDAFRPTALFTAPAHVAACRDAGLLTRERLASLGFIMISGSACAPELALETEGIEAGAVSAVGELQVRGCSLFAGYLANDEANAAAFTADGWFRTGDLATIDEAGNVHLVGRAKELINRGGVKFNPVDVEAVLDRHPAIVQSAIVPMPDPVLGERACCFVVLKPGATFTLEDARAWLDRQAIGKIRWPERVEVIEAMPLTPTRKIMKGELVKRLQAKAA
jgi:cyclohexanecarboxylate-CoA ligase/acyl-CoA synthetase